MADVKTKPLKVSPAGKLTGWNFLKWVKKNKDNLKLIVSVTAGIGVTLLSNLDPLWALPLGSLVTAGSKILLDTIDFWVSEVKLE